MKKMFILISLIASVALYAAVNKDAAAVDFVKTVIEKSKGKNGYLDALRFFQYTATVAKENPSSYIHSKWGETPMKESGLEKPDKGKYISVLKNRSAARIGKLWKNNREELLKLLPASVYEESLKSEIDSLVKFRSDSRYASLIKKMKAKSKKPGVKSIDIAGKITGWSGYRELSFWYRRVVEKNDKVVFEILKELQANYAK